MEPNERIMLMLNLMGEESGTPTATPSVAPTVVSNGSDSIAPPVLNTPSTAPITINDDVAQGDTDIGSGSDAAQYAEAISSYCGITGSDEESARHLLEVNKKESKKESKNRVLLSKFHICFIFQYKCLHH
jgi:hypothetical protein